MNGDDDESLMKQPSAEIVVLRAIHEFLQACITVEESDKTLSRSHKE